MARENDVEQQDAYVDDTADYGIQVSLDCQLKEKQL
jgi:hypothetical protein